MATFKLKPLGGEDDVKVFRPPPRRPVRRAELELELKELEAKRADVQRRLDELLALDALEGEESEETFEKRMRLYRERYEPVAIKVRRVSRELFRGWNYEQQRIDAENRFAVRALRQTFAREDWPALWAEGDDFYQTDATIQARTSLMKEVVTKTVTELRGVEVEGAPPEAYTTPERIAEIVDHADLLGSVFAAAMINQNPERAETFSSGS